MLSKYNKNAYDGVFYMEWSSFIKYFRHLVSICEVDDSSHYLYHEMEFKHRTVEYLELRTDGRPERIGVMLAQQMEQHFSKNYKYCDICVIVAKEVEENGRKVYKFIWAENYYSTRLDNYFTLKLRSLERGKYLNR